MGLACNPHNHVVHENPILDVGGNQHVNYFLRSDIHSCIPLVTLRVTSEAGTDANGIAMSGGQLGIELVCTGKTGGLPQCFHSTTAVFQMGGRKKLGIAQRRREMTEVVRRIGHKTVAKVGRNER